MPKKIVHFGENTLRLFHKDSIIQPLERKPKGKRRVIVLDTPCYRCGAEQTLYEHLCEECINREIKLDKKLGRKTTLNPMRRTIQIID